MGLTTKQKRFIECFDGNATEAARQAGYSPRTVRTVGCENMTKPDIVAAIREREEKRVNSLILSREERQIFWSNVVRDPDEDMKNLRLELGKEKDSIKRGLQPTEPERPFEETWAGMKAKYYGEQLEKNPLTANLALPAEINDVIRRRRNFGRSR